MNIWLVVTRRLFGVIVALCLFPSVGMSQTGTTDVDIIEQIRAKAQRAEEFKALLNNPDANIRVATMEALIGGDDPVLKDIAIETGFASDDVIVKAAALRALFFSLDTIIVTIKRNKAKDDEQTAEETQTYKFSEINREKGTFNLDYGGGQVSGTTVSFKYRAYSYILQPGADFTLSGPVTDGGQSYGIATIKLR